MHITTHAAVDVPRPRQMVFDYAVRNDTLARSLRPYGPIAGIVDGEILDGQALRTGARRKITMSDGTVLIEDILELERPTRHRYKWSAGLRPPFVWLVKSGEASWSFSDIEGGTRIDWSYVFELTNPLAWALAAPILRLFTRWQTKGLVRIREALVGNPTSA